MTNNTTVNCFITALSMHYKRSRLQYGITNRCLINTRCDSCFCLTEEELSIFWAAISCAVNLDCKITCNADLIPQADGEPSLSNASKCSKGQYRTPRIDRLFDEQVDIEGNDSCWAYSTLCAIVAYHTKNRTLIETDSMSSKMEELLAGLLVMNSQFADAYFMSIRNLLTGAVGDNVFSLIQQLKGIIGRMEQWKKQNLDYFKEKEIIQFLEKAAAFDRYEERLSFALAVYDKTRFSTLNDSPSDCQKSNPCIEFINCFRKIAPQRNASILAFLKEIECIRFNGQKKAELKASLGG